MSKKQQVPKMKIQDVKPGEKIPPEAMLELFQKNEGFFKKLESESVHEKVSAAKLLFENKRIDIVELRSNEGVVIVIDDILSLVFLKNDSGEIRFDGWEARNPDAVDQYQPYWKDWAGQRI